MTNQTYSRKNSELRRIINSSELSFLMESHNALSAKIAEQAGFSALWASGLTMSASMGLSDRNEASWTQVLGVVEFMAEHVDIPILMDGDTGFGNYQNVIRLVKKLGQIHVSGVCFEDKLFPKMNSFIGEKQSLTDVQDFCSKIKAAKDHQVDENFTVIARTEALISGLGMKEALFRAEKYHEAGADAILIHSKKTNALEVLEFTKEWGNRSPVIIIPTKYHKTPASDYRSAGISSVIWANHSLRASIIAMKEITQSIFNNESIQQVEGRISSIEDIFSLTNEIRAIEAEKRYSVGNMQ